MPQDAVPLPTVKRMRLRYAGSCSNCGTALPQGEPAYYDRGAKTVHCIQCPGQATPAVATATTAVSAIPPLSPITAPGVSLPATSEPIPAAPVPAAAAPIDCAAPRSAPTPVIPLDIIDGTAGGSAVREYERRHGARQMRVQTNHPKIGKFLLAVFDDPQSTTAWSTGAVGEQALGQALAKIAGPSLRILHDRRVPKTRANIDHLAICPTGVYVIDAKRYVDKRPALQVHGGLFSPRTEVLLVAGRDRSKLVEGMHKQLSLVRAALADFPEVPVRAVLCFVDADWPLIGGSFEVEGVAVAWPKKLYSWLKEPGNLDENQVAELQWRLHEAFPRQRQT